MFGYYPFAVNLYKSLHAKVLWGGRIFTVEVVTWSFLYERLGLRTGRPLAGQTVQYHVRTTIQRGIPAWRINMKSAGVDTTLYIRRDNGASPYLKRVDHVRQRTVGIRYGLSTNEASIYRG